MSNTISKLLSNPGFWRGAAAARSELLRRYGSEADLFAYHSAIRSHEAIAAALAAGTPLWTIPEFSAWADTAYSRAPGAPA